MGNDNLGICLFRGCERDCDCSAGLVCIYPENTGTPVTTAGRLCQYPTTAQAHGVACTGDAGVADVFTPSDGGGTDPYPTCSGSSCPAGSICQGLMGGSADHCFRSCTTPSDCLWPSTGSGTIPTCSTGTIHFCFLQCNSSSICPSGMRCVAFDSSPGSYARRIRCKSFLIGDVDPVPSELSRTTTNSPSIRTGCSPLS